jgi:1-acyl-sn-glycerol-3-phosphate acyltransferase
MGRENISSFSPGYQVLYLLAGIFHRLYYKRYSVKGRENIPRNAPVIFAITHQNALMDALAVLFAARRQTVFFARADIFRKKSIARILFFLKILPVYRPRDGFRSVDQNQDVFREGIKALKRNRPVAILPEGNHVGQKRLRPLRKGAARLALFAEQASDFNLGLQIVPVGLDYSNYFKAGSDLLVNFGKPIPVCDYKDQYRENQPRAVSRLTEDLSVALKTVMIDIEPEKNYDDLFLASEIFFHHHLKTNKKKASLYQSFILKKNITEEFNDLYREDPDRIEDISGSCSTYARELKRHKLQEKVVSKGKQSFCRFIFEMIIMLILFPVHALGTIIHYLPFRISTNISSRLKDPYLRVSVRFGASFMLFMIWYLLLAIIIMLLPLPLPWKMVFLISIPLAGGISFYYHGYIRMLVGKWRWIKLWKWDRKEYERIIQLRNKIIDVAPGMMKE